MENVKRETLKIKARPRGARAFFDGWSHSKDTFNQPDSGTDCTEEDEQEQQGLPNDDLDHLLNPADTLRDNGGNVSEKSRQSDSSRLNISFLHFTNTNDAIYNQDKNYQAHD